jgi:branched-chain amino acid transport system permease protein
MARTAIMIYKGAISAVLGIVPQWLEYILIGLIIALVVLFRPKGILPEKPVLTLPKEKIRKISEES